LRVSTKNSLRGLRELRAVGYQLDADIWKGMLKDEKARLWASLTLCWSPTICCGRGVGCQLLLTSEKLCPTGQKVVAQRHHRKKHVKPCDQGQGNSTRCCFEKIM
jgi:hypothetical protein